MKDFVFKKKFGQNFLTDTNLLKGICNDAEIMPGDQVLEIGPGMGALTKQLCAVANKVVAYEIDEQLKPFLFELNCPNLTVIYKDILKTDMAEVESFFQGDYKLVANLPYYITSPILFKFLTQSKKLTSLTIMVQKEVGQRMAAKPGSKNYGLLSVSCNFFGDAKILRNVSRKMFSPPPEVDSCIVGLKIDRGRFDVSAEDFFVVAKMCFKSRRKTILNNLAEGLGVSKQKLESLGIDLTRRAEELDTSEFVALTKLLKANFNVAETNR